MQTKYLLIALLVVIADLSAAHRGHRGHRRHHHVPPAESLICRTQAGSHHVRTRSCPGQASCSVGPLVWEHYGTHIHQTLCDSVDQEGNLLALRHACRIELEDGSLIERTPRSRSDPFFCTKGPLQGVQFDGQPATVYFPERRVMVNREAGAGEDQSDEI